MPSAQAPARPSRMRMEAWAPTDAVLCTVAAPLGEELAKDLHNKDAWELAADRTHTANQVFQPKVESVNGPAFMAVSPHNDPGFDPWFLLFIARAGTPKALHNWDTTRAERVWPKDAAREAWAPAAQIVPLEQGHLVLLPSRYVHAVRLTDPAAIKLERQLERWWHALGTPEPGGWTDDTLRQVQKKARAHGITDAHIAAQPTLTVCMELAQRPRSRAAAEQAMREHLQAYAPRCMQRWGVPRESVATPSRLRARRP